MNAPAEMPDLSSLDPETIAIVGSGPTAVYLLKALIDQGRQLTVFLYESGETPGVGTPYDARRNAPSMLANIASIELPPVTESLLEWLYRQSAEALRAWNVSPDDLHERHFFPRIVLGRYFADQLDQLCAHSEGCIVVVKTNTRVIDVVATADGVNIRAQGSSGALEEMRCDFAVLATGHQLPAIPRDSASPAQDHRETLAYARLGILGTSLSAIDVAVAHALTFGTFVEQDKELRFVRHDGLQRQSITMLSRRGLLPEADFFCPIPYEPLKIFTADRATALVAGRDGDLDRLFDLFRDELAACDPDYAIATDLAEVGADEFADRYFAQRLNSDAFAWAAQNLDEVCQNHRDRHTVAWRYALLRMHEQFGQLASRLSDRDLARFNAGLRLCFIDNYAAVPPLSIARLLALHHAGILSIARLGATYGIAFDKASRQWQVESTSFNANFDAMIDARGQPPLGQDEFPFPTLRLQIRAESYRQGWGRRNLNLRDDFALAGALPSLSRIYCLSAPYLLRTNPFIQGLTASADMAQAVAHSLATRWQRPYDRAEDDTTLAELVARFDAAPLMFCMAGSETIAVDGIPAHPCWPD